MNETLLKILRVLKFILALVPKAQSKWIADKFLDYIEDLVEESENKIDDTILPLIKIFRDSYDIEDND